MRRKGEGGARAGEIGESTRESCSYSKLLAGTALKYSKIFIFSKIFRINTHKMVWYIKR